MADQQTEPARREEDSAQNQPPGETFDTFGGYVRGHFRKSRGPWAFGVVGAILAAPALSLARPAIGLPGMGVALLGVAGLFVLFGAMFLVGRMGGFFVRGQREVGDDARSFVAPFAFASLILLIALAPLVIAECFVGDAGVLATMAPALEKMQADMKLRPADDAQQVADAGEAPPAADGDESSGNSDAGDDGDNGGQSGFSEADKVQPESRPDETDEPGPAEPRSGAEDRGSDQRERQGSKDGSGQPDDISVTVREPERRSDPPENSRDDGPPELSETPGAMRAIQEALLCETIYSRKQLNALLQRYLDIAKGPERMTPAPGTTLDDSKRQFREAYRVAVNQLQFVFPRDFAVYGFEVETSGYDSEKAEFPRMRIQVGDAAWRDDGAIGADLFRREPAAPENRVIGAEPYVALTNSAWPDSPAPLSPKPSLRVWFSKDASGEPLDPSDTFQRKQLATWLEAAPSSSIVCLGARCPAPSAPAIQADNVKAAVHFRVIPADLPRMLAGRKVGAPTLAPVRFVLYAETPGGPQVVYALTLNYARPAPAKPVAGSEPPKVVTKPGRASKKPVDSKKLVGAIAEVLKPYGKKMHNLDFVRFYSEDYAKYFRDVNQAEVDTLDVRIGAGIQINPYFPYSVAGAAGKAPNESLQTFNQRIESFAKIAKEAETRIASAMDLFVGGRFGGGQVCVYGIPAYGSDFDPAAKRLNSVSIAFAGIDRDPGPTTVELLPLNRAPNPRRALTGSHPKIGALLPAVGGLRIGGVELDLAEAEALNNDFVLTDGLKAAMVLEYVGFIRPLPDTQVRTRLPLLPRRVVLYQAETGRVIVDVDLKGEALHPDFLRLPLLRNPYPGREMRAWTDARGNRQIAKFINKTRDVVLLRDEDGNDFELPLKNLSPKDRNFVRKLTAKKEE